MKVKHKPVEICLQKKIHFRRHIKNQARRYLTAWFFIFITSLVACAPAVTPAPTLINVQLNWVHYGPFAGLYAADQNGYYKENGISVSFQEAGVSDDPIQPVLDGIAHFGVLGADQIISARAEGTPIRAIAATFRRSPVVFVAPAESGITHPHHFAGKTIRVTPNIVPSLHAMTTRVGVMPAEYTEITLPSDISLWAAGEADVWGMFINSFAITLERAGNQLNYIFPDDYGVHFYGDVIFTTDAMIEQDPDLVLRFLEATLRGYTYAVENPTEASSFIVRYDSVADPALSQAQMLASIPLIHTSNEPIGWMKLDEWEEIVRTLGEYNALNMPLDITKVFTTQFLEEIYTTSP